MSNFRPRPGAAASFCVCALLLIASFAAADAGNAAWSDGFATSGFDASDRAAVDFDGDLVVAGDFPNVGDGCGGAESRGSTALSGTRSGKG